MAEKKSTIGAAGAIVLAALAYFWLKGKGTTPPPPPPGSAKVFGYIAGPVGENISGVTVKLGSRTTTTNAAGYYEFTGVTPGSYLLTISIGGYDTISQTITVVEGDNNKSYQLTIHWDVISGTVRTSGGTPLAGVEIRLGNAAQPEGAITHTDANGAFSFSPAGGFFIPWDMGPYTLTFLLSGWKTEVRTIERVPGDKTLTITMTPLAAEKLTYLNALVTLWLPSYAPPGASWRGVTYTLTVANPHSVEVTKNLTSWWDFNFQGALSTGFVYSLTVPAGATRTVDITVPLEHLTVLLGYPTDIWFVDDDLQNTPKVRI